MEPPSPPRDIGLKNLIDKLAEFVARNGPEFEQITKQKQNGNPKFEFLFGGKYFTYYQHRVNAEQSAISQQVTHSTNQNVQASLNVRQINTSNMGVNQVPFSSQHVLPNLSQQIPPSNWVGNTTNGNSAVNLAGQYEAINLQQMALREQIHQSEKNLTAQHSALRQQQDNQIDDAIEKAQNESLELQADDNNIILTDFDAVLQPIIESCTKDSISTGKNWILQHTTDTAKCNVVLQYLLKKALIKGSTFSQKLHLIYLVNDVLHHCVRKNANELKSELENVVIPMFCSADLIAIPEQKAKLTKLLSLWESKAKFFDACVISKLESPESSMQEYKTNLRNRYNEYIKMCIQNVQSTLENYQQQHKIFIQHTTNQIAALENQKKIIEAQIMASTLPNTSVMPPQNPQPAHQFSQNQQQYPQNQQISISNQQQFPQNQKSQQIVNNTIPSLIPTSVSSYQGSNNSDKNSYDSYISNNNYDDTRNVIPPQQTQLSQTQLQQPQTQLQPPQLQLQTQTQLQSTHQKQQPSLPQQPQLQQPQQHQVLPKSLFDQAEQKFSHLDSIFEMLNPPSQTQMVQQQPNCHPSQPQLSSHSQQQLPPSQQQTSQQPQLQQTQQHQILPNIIFDQLEQKFSHIDALFNLINHPSQSSIGQQQQPSNRHPPPSLMAQEYQKPPPDSDISFGAFIEANVKQASQLPQGQNEFYYSNYPNSENHTFQQQQPQALVQPQPHLQTQQIPLLPAQTKPPTISYPAHFMRSNQTSKFLTPLPNFLIPDLSKPPPNIDGNQFSTGQGEIGGLENENKSENEQISEESIKPIVPYYELPAGLMVPLIRLEDYNYKSLDPEDIRLPAPQPQSERLTSALAAFYSLPSHDRPRDVEGWEKLGLYEYYKVKNAAKKQKEEEIQKGIREKSRSPTPVILEPPKPKRNNKRRYRSKSRGRSKSRSKTPPRRPRSRSNSPQVEKIKSRSRKSPKRNRERERERDQIRERKERDRDRSISPPSFFGGNYPKSNDFIEETNKGHQMLTKMGWGGSGTGLGSKQQGIDSPIQGGEIRDKKDMYKGLGLNMIDPFENFRKNKGAAFIHRMRTRAEEKS